MLMKKLTITGNYANAVECKGHPSLIFDNSTNVCVVVYLTITTKEGGQHPFTLLITDKTAIDKTIEELKQSFGENFADINILEPLQLTSL